MVFLFSSVSRELELTEGTRAFGDDKEVGRLTCEMSPWIDKTRENPYLVSRLIRHLSLTVMLCWSRAKHLPFAFRNFLSIQSSRNISQDASTAEQGSPALSQEAKEGLQRAKEDFRKALMLRFGDSEFLKELTTTIENWENP